ncbi:MAG: zinc ribbon domain-containing protein [Aquabacterium sp.]|nr:MAG: zinc ribbon domain-containing protein [Aquabacterium sp.]
MPTYDYDCPDCGGFDAFRSLSMRNEPAACPQCATPSPRVFVSAPSLSCMADSTRRAIEGNERAANAPISSKDYGAYKRMKHGSGCGCCSTPSNGSIRSATVRSASGAKAFPSKRPWMISH